MRKLKKRGDRILEMFNIKNLILLVFDAFLIAVSFFIAIYMMNDLQLTRELFYQFLIELPVIILMYWVLFELFTMYRSLWKFASIEEVIKGVLANGIATLASFFLVKLIYEEPMSGLFYFLAFFLATSATLGVRLSYRFLRVFRNYALLKDNMSKGIIIGAGSAGNLVLKEISHNDYFDSEIVGFIDDDPSKLHKVIHGVEVIGTMNEIEEIITQYKIDVVYVAIPKASQKRIREILNQVQKSGVQIKLFPPFYELLRDRKDTKVKLRDVKIEDLLGRDEIKLEEDGIREYIDGKTVLVTGGGGSIGSELCRQLRRFNPSKIIILDIYENNAYDLQMEFDRMYRLNKVHHKPEIIVLIASVRDEKRLDEIFSEYKPNVVFHAAAHKHVPLMEVSPMEALKNNTVGTYNVAMASDKHNVEKFVLISTDKAVNPTNIMGASKRAAEKVIFTINQDSKTEFSAVRFGNVLGSNGSVIPLFKKQIEDGGPITVTHPDIIRYFMTIPEACQLVIQAGAYAKGGELFVLDMGEPVRILDLAENMIRLSGLDPYVDIDILFTGLRPGEKMFEELLIDIKSTIRTNNEMIFVEKENKIKRTSEEDILLLVEQLSKDEVFSPRNELRKYVKSYKER